MIWTWMGWRVGGCFAMAMALGGEIWVWLEAELVIVIGVGRDGVWGCYRLLVDRSLGLHGLWMTMVV